MKQITINTKRWPVPLTNRLAINCENTPDYSGMCRGTQWLIRLNLNHRVDHPD